MQQKKIYTYDIPKITRIDGEVRLYETPSGKRYPSVTSVVGMMTKSYIDEWRAKVGEQVANEISSRAANRGTLIHENCENYLKGLPLTFSMFQQEEKRMFDNFLPLLKQITEIHGIETQLYSDKLQVAGTVDLVCKIGNDYYILDWKTSSRYKSEEDIEHYFMQCAAYSFMFYERTGVIASKIKIAMTTEEFGLLVFDQPTHKWLQKFITLREEYAKTHGR
jgi:predicted RecB family nuclease